ncbi:MAG: type II toxin-antitoxin system RelE/ParE family toxin [Bryobacteraceae bacterium]
MEPQIREVEYYRTKDDKAPFKTWHLSLKDRKMQARVDARIARLRMGLLGKCEPVGDGVFELKDDYGPGYRFYFAEDRGRVVLLLCGGDKSSQKADIQAAKSYWEDHQQRRRASETHVKQKRKLRR